MKKRTKKKYLEIGSREEYDYHLPVMKNEAIDWLITDGNGIYIDGTLGGGGHTAEILGRLGAGGKLLAFDLDKEAVEYCKEKFKDEILRGESSRLELYNQPYSKACSIRTIEGKLKGFLLDLGVSSRQLDDKTKGFTYRENARLDLRFSQDYEPAEALLAVAKEEEIADILRKYGEEPFAKSIARRIVELRRAVPINTTAQLREIVEYCVPRKYLNRSLSRVFQALRIYINDELTQLSETLNCIPFKLAIGGRIVVISYHSLEDRIAKESFRKYSKTLSRKNGDDKLKVKEQDLDTQSKEMPILKVLTKKTITPTHQEITTNPRARSAKMRVAERI